MQRLGAGPHCLHPALNVYIGRIAPRTPPMSQAEHAEGRGQAAPRSTVGLDHLPAGNRRQLVQARRGAP
jgi:hypothetical protein